MDEDMSTVFGFRNCETRVVLDKRIGALLQTWIDRGTLVAKIEDMIGAGPGKRPACHQWFLSSNEMVQEGESRLPAYVECGFIRAFDLLVPESDSAGNYRGRAVAGLLECTGQESICVGGFRVLLLPR